DVPQERFVEVAVDESLSFLTPGGGVDQRAYAERLTRLRPHQPVFRARVIRAYDTQCSMCRLKHAELLDAYRDARPDRRRLEERQEQFRAAG
ncbi:MAG: hypothetical protein ABJA34_03285, partial [Pseudonocardiales bacterium]